MYGIVVFALGDIGNLTQLGKLHSIASKCEGWVQLPVCSPEQRKEVVRVIRTYFIVRGALGNMGLHEMFFVFVGSSGTANAIMFESMGCMGSELAL